MTILRIYVSAACASCTIAYERVAQVRRLRPHQLVEPIDLDEARAERIRQSAGIWKRIGLLIG
jgi:hypothetical protein